MRYFRFFLISIFFLNGCIQTPPPSETIADSALQSLDSISASLPQTCKTDAIESQINAARTAIKATISACQLEKDKITAEKIRWQWAFGALFLIIIAYLGRKIIL